MKPNKTWLTERQFLTCLLTFSLTRKIISTPTPPREYPNQHLRIRYLVTRADLPLQPHLSCPTKFA